MEKVITKTQIKDAVESAYSECRNLKGGRNADYIPYLANIDKELFGISLTLSDGTTFAVGDTGYKCRRYWV